MSGQQRQRERWWRAGEGTEERNAATRLAGERQKKTKTKQTERERGRNGTEVCDAVQTDWPFEKQQGPSEGQQEPGSTVWFSIRTRKLHNRVKSCSYTNIWRNKSL